MTCNCCLLASGHLVHFSPQHHPQQLCLIIAAFFCHAQVGLVLSLLECITPAVKEKQIKKLLPFISRTARALADFTLRLHDYTRPQPSRRVGMITDHFLWALFTGIMKKRLRAPEWHTSCRRRVLNDQNCAHTSESPTD